MNYNELATKVQEFKENNNQEFVSNIPYFVEAACRTIAKEVDSVGLNTSATLTPTSGSPVLTLPSECFVIKSLAAVSGTTKSFLKCRPYDYIVQLWPDAASVGTPSHYARVNDSEVYVVKTPDASNSFELKYVTVSIPSSASPNCYLLDRYPNLLMYRTMAEANTFMMDWDDAAKWQALYDRERGSVANEARRNRRDDGNSVNPMQITVNQNNLEQNKP